MNPPEFGQPLPGITYVDRPGAYALLYNDLGHLALVCTGHGVFLPGGGLNAGEDELTGLKREVFEEIGFEITSAHLVARACQYHWSNFYQSHFRKVGAFFRVEATVQEGAKCQDEHALIWRPVADAARELTQEFQRWVIAQHG